MLFTKANLWFLRVPRAVRRLRAQVAPCLAGGAGAHRDPVETRGEVPHGTWACFVQGRCGHLEIIFLIEFIGETWVNTVI